MSKEKMDVYKEQKVNRKKKIARERRNKKIAKYAWRIAGVVIVVAIVVAVGLTGWNSYQTYEASLPDYTSTEQVIEDITGILDMEDGADTAEEEAAEEEDEAAEEEADDLEDAGDGEEADDADEADAAQEDEE